MFCKNLTVYTISNVDILNKINNELLQKLAFTPCSPLDSLKGGFISPIDNPETLLIDIQGQILLKYQTEQKTIPADVIKRALNEKIEKQELALCRKLAKCEKSSLKDEVIIDLLPRAFSKFKQFNVWINKRDKFIAITTSSFKQAEDILALLRKELGSLALTPLSIDKPIEQIMTKWVKENLNFPPFVLGDQAELKDPLEGNGIISCKNQEINSYEMLAHFDSGKWITKIRIIDDRGVSYILNNNFVFKNIKFDQSVIDENEDVPLDDKEARIKADFFLASNVLSKTIIQLKDTLNKII
jgi:recombination associated protein RdgC